ncbi:hypothetical protein C240_2304 [Enterococcus sp. 5H]|nr:hypothetical protein [Enterococcus sp. 5H]
MGRQAPLNLKMDKRKEDYQLLKRYADKFLFRFYVKGEI